MKDQVENPPAFPCTIKDRFYPSNSELERLPGMTLRDYFAGQALTGQIASPEPILSTTREELVNNIAKFAYEYADAMLKERMK